MTLFLILFLILLTIIKATAAGQTPMIRYRMISSNLYLNKNSKIDTHNDKKWKFNGLNCSTLSSLPNKQILPIQAFLLLFMKCVWINNSNQCHYPNEPHHFILNPSKVSQSQPSVETGCIMYQCTGP